jgi:hypothetical protein
MKNKIITFKNKQTGQLFKVKDTGNPNWPYAAVLDEKEQGQLFMELAFKYKCFDNKKFRMDWENITDYCVD